jgi:hypothetical protein
MGSEDERQKTPVLDIVRLMQSAVPAPEEWVARTSGKIIPCGKSTAEFKVEKSCLKSG